MSKKVPIRVFDDTFEIPTPRVYAGRHGMLIVLVPPIAPAGYRIVREQQSL